MGTKATREDLGDLGVVYSHLFEQVKQGKRPAAPVIKGIQLLSEGSFRAGTRFIKYAPMLPSLFQQMLLIQFYNEQFWNNYFTGEELASVDVSSTRPQTIEDFEILHVEFGSPEETHEMWIRVLEATLGRFRRINLPDQSCKRSIRKENTFHYPAGIHHVHIYLASGWEPNSNQYFNPTKPVDRLTHFGHSEVLSAYGLSPDLVEKQDGVGFPYAAIAGYQVAGEEDIILTPALRYAGERSTYGNEMPLGLHLSQFATPSVWKDSFPI